jgi:GrpB-like predicted nucleotidyltransferase (UPF0157 family)
VDQPLTRHPSLEDRFDPAVRIVEHDPRWATEAQSELGRIKQVLGPLAVRLEHVGSTSVPGLAAKPIVDLQVSLAALEPRDAYVRPLQGLGYLFVPAPESPDYHLFARPPQRPRTHHLHVCTAGSEHEFRHLALRDFLRAHPAEAQRYERLKIELAERTPRDRLVYMGAKEPFLDELEVRAGAWARRRDS